MMYMPNKAQGLLVKAIIAVMGINLFLIGYVANGSHAFQYLNLMWAKGGRVTSHAYPNDTFNYAKESAYWKNKANNYNAAMPLTTPTDFFSVARGYCYGYLTQADACHNIKFGMLPNKANEALGVTYIVYGDYNTVPGIKFNSSLLGMTRAKQNWLIYHELSHAEVALMAGNANGEKGITQRAKIAFNSPEPEEVLADCMALRKAHQNFPNGELPYYLSRVENVNTMNIGVMCNSWSGVIYNNLEGGKVTAQ